MLKKAICKFTITIACASVCGVVSSVPSRAQDAQSEPRFLEARPVHDPVQVERTRAEWQRELQDLGMKGSLAHCQLMVETIYENTKDESYGAVCSFDGGSRPRDIMLCEDTLVGNLTIRAWGFAIAKDSVLNFTKQNCPAGG
ncbi:hypothetical protein OKW45_002719 [Paraburkholderia sp. WSM4175]|uniref:hypothetical protein n=1 Tax=Paraburkholderia sp. WSM4175 TaxID=2991072 RepID=UPI003D21EE89